MKRKSRSHYRLSQFHRMQVSMSADQLRKALETRHAPPQLRLLTWGFSKVVNVAMAIAGVFKKPTRGDLSLVEFKLMALGYFLPLKSVVELDVEVERLADKQKALKDKLNQFGLLDRPNADHPLMHDWQHTIDESEKLIHRIHAAYRQYVTLF